MAHDRSRNKTKKSRKRTKLLGHIVKPTSKPIGAPPGSLIYTGEQKTEQLSATYIKFDNVSVQEGICEINEHLDELSQSRKVLWIDVVGLHDVEKIQRIGEAFFIHPLLLEDILNPGQRPKTEEYEKTIMIILKDMEFDETSKSVIVEQVSIVMGQTFVISFREKPGQLLDPVRTRILAGGGQIRRRDTDYLTYAMVDCIVDKCFAQLETMGYELDELNEMIMTGHPDESLMKRLHALRREMLLFRKSVWPLREILSALYRSENGLIKKTTIPYLRDAHDHSVQILDIVETFQEAISDMMDLYLSTVSNRMNEVMKVLTMIATIFIPLSFLAGVYGMNFEYMPELKLRWGYPAILILMGIVFVGMILYFRRKKWL